MKYEKLIMEQFDSIGFSPRNGQVCMIDNILIEFFDNKKKYVVANAPTGSGKSIIGVITAKCINELEDEHYFEVKTKGKTKKVKYKTSEILSHTNILSHQYRDTFGDLYDKKDNDGFAMIKGATHYSCKALGKDATASDCIINMSPQSMTKHCLSCEYLQNKKDVKSKEHLITNYSYYFSDKIFANNLPKRLITIFDEVQLINNVFTSMYELKLNVEIMDRLINVLEKNKVKGVENYITQLKNEKNSIFIPYEYYEIDTDMKNNLSRVYNIFSEISDFYNEFIVNNYLKMQKDGKNSYEQIKNSTVIKKLNKVKSIFSSKSRAFNVMQDYIFSTNNYVGEYKDESISFKPIFIKELFKDKLTSSKYNLLMSATISDVYIEQTLNISPDEMAFINAKPTFDPENKALYLLNHASYNYNYLKQQDNVENIAELVEEIIDHHSSDNGIIQVTSFYLSDRIAWFIKQHNSKMYKKLYIHKKGEKLEDVLNGFKSSSKKILISPSLWEGVDLPDDDARYNIMVKCPYYSLADARIKMIMEQYPDIYKIMTIFRISQGMGRIVRNEVDYGVSYCLDSNIGKLFDSKLNVWKKQFKIMDI